MNIFAHRSWRRSAMLTFALALVCTISSGVLPAFDAYLDNGSAAHTTYATSQLTPLSIVPQVLSSAKISQILTAFSVI
jgi:hypothetical protein